MNNETLEKIIECLIVLLIWFLILFSIFGVASCFNQKKCLEKGFPKSETTIFLDGYCVNISGTEVVEL